MFPDRAFLFADAERCWTAGAIMRTVILSELDLIASPGAQLAYDASLTRAGHAPTELISRFCDDLFHPRDLDSEGSFSDDELKGLAHIYGLIVEAGRAQHSTVAAMLRDPVWRRVVARAKDLRTQLARALPAGDTV